MDFIENKWKKWCNRIRNTGLKKALAIYILGGIVIAFLCSLLAVYYFESWKKIIVSVDMGKFFKGVVYNGTFYSEIMGELSAPAKKQILVLNWMEIGFVFLIAAIAIVAVSNLYYKSKFEEPFWILQKEMQNISRDDLSFDCSYLSKDEMGEICTGFNQMRLQLCENKKNLWELMKSQRELNAAFAHDIRTPLTVIKGYTQMLLKYYPAKQISEEKLIKTLEMIDSQVNRLESFSATMKEIHSFEELKPKKEYLNMKELATKITHTMQGISHNTMNIFVNVKNDDKMQEDPILFCDATLIQEVIDNIVANSLRFAIKNIYIEIYLEDGKLYVYVKDDGIGFSSEALVKGMRPYFSSDKEHFGLGLTISQILCKKHGGNLEIMNAMNGGAIVSVCFYVA